MLPDGSRNAIRIQRLKDKLGNKANASSEVEFHGASAWLCCGSGIPRRKMSSPCSVTTTGTCIRRLISGTQPAVRMLLNTTTSGLSSPVSHSASRSTSFF